LDRFFRIENFAALLFPQPASSCGQKEISKHLRSFLPYVVPRLRKNEIWRQLYIQHNYVVYYYICVDADRQDSFAVRVLTRRWDDTRAELLLYAVVPTPPTAADANRHNTPPSVVFTLVALISHSHAYPQSISKVKLRH